MELGGDAINRPEVPTKWGKSQTNGSKAASRLLSTLARQQVASSRSRSCLIAVDGFLGSVWDSIISDAEETLDNSSVKCVTVDMGSYFKPNEELERMLVSVLASDKFFGRIFDGDLEDLLDLDRIRSLRRQLDEYRKKKTVSDYSSRVAVFCHGFGARALFLTYFY